MHLFLNCLAASAGGGLTYVRNIVPHLAERTDLRATIAIDSRLSGNFAAVENISFLRIEASPSAAARFWFEQTRLPDFVRRSHADVVVSTGNFALRRSPIPQILLTGNSLYCSPDFLRDLLHRGEYRMWLDTRLRGAFARRSVFWADRAVTPSRSFADQLHQWTGGDVSCIHHGFDPAIFFQDQSPLPVEIQSKLDSASGKLRLLFVSHYNYYRNFETLLKAVPYLVNELGPDKIRLFLTCMLFPHQNPGHFDPTSARNLIGELGISEQVVELGAVPYEHLYKVYQACDLYVTPAYAETFAYPLVEAMACGLPIVASDLPVHREITSQSAQFFPVFSHKDLAQHVLLLANSAELRNNQIEAGKRRAADFSWTTHVDKLLTLAESLLRENPQARH
ncbi:MAG TPA: glycosyltransferase family 1 protein [Terriglobales bacterium]